MKSKFVIKEDPTGRLMFFDTEEQVVWACEKFWGVNGRVLGPIFLITRETPAFIRKAFGIEVKDAKA